MALTRSETDLGEVDCGKVEVGQNSFAIQISTPYAYTPLVHSHLTFFAGGLRIKWIQIRKIDTLQPFHSFYYGASLIYTREHTTLDCIYKSALSISFRIPVGIRITSNQILSILFSYLIQRSDYANLQMKFT